MKAFRVILAAAGTGYVLHVPGQSEEAARAAALAKIARDFPGREQTEIRVRRVERIGA